MQWYSHEHYALFTSLVPANFFTITSLELSFMYRKSNDNYPVVNVSRLQITTDLASIEVGALGIKAAAYLLLGVGPTPSLAG
jgi:hypothetical protein